MDELAGQEQVEDQDKLDQAAVTRQLTSSGRELEALRLSLKRQQDSQRYVYKLELRAPTKKSSEWLCIIKALTPDGPVITFHNGGSLLSTLTGVGRRFRAGAVEWHEDGFPPDDWEERLSFLYQNVTWVMF